VSGGLDPVTLSVLASALAGIAEEMGAVLVRGAYSSNIKERRDCSAALFDREGRMVAQAEHIPVHLGAMPESVAAVMEHDPQPGDVWLLNDPFRGVPTCPTSPPWRPSRSTARWPGSPSRAPITPTSAA
jgi:N-methylhydantoinase B